MPPVPSAEKPSAITADELEEIVQPLVNYLRDLDSDDCVEPDEVIIEIAEPLGLQSSLPAGFIQLPQNLCDRPWLHRGLVRALLALLARSVWASSCCKAGLAEQNCRCCPLQFRLVKQTRELPGMEHYWSCMHLAVEAVSSDVAAAERQVALLIRFLREDTEVLARDVEDFLQL